MRRGLPLLSVAILIVAGCGEQPLPPEVQTSDLPLLGFGVPEPGRTLRMLDVCDPESFNAVFGPGTCVGRRGGLTLDKFVKSLEMHQTVESWRFMPARIQVAAGTTLPVLNAGGEVHTFTEVADFGGGIIEFLNIISGNPVPAQECLDAGAEEFLASGEDRDVSFTDAGEKKYMCCIHPWMRAVAEVR